MKVYLPNYKYKEPFDKDDCKDCKFNVGEAVVKCSNPEAVHYIHMNLKCGVRDEREDN